MFVITEISSEVREDFYEKKACYELMFSFNSEGLSL